MTCTFKKQTLSKVYEQLIASEGVERNALGDFVNDFFKYYTNERQSLLDDPIQMPEQPGEDERGWAAFCASCAEYLAERYGLRCPDWAYEPVYILETPWYHPASTAFPNLRKQYELQAPAAFRRRNVFCSDRIFSNPYSSSKEPGNLSDIHQKRTEILATLSQSEREAYIVTTQAKMAGRPRVRIVA